MDQRIEGDDKRIFVRKLNCSMAPKVDMGLRPKNYEQFELFAKRFHPKSLLNVN